MRKVLILLLTVFLTGCYTVLKVPTQKRAQKAEVTFGVDANRGDYCYTQKYYETVYIRERSSSTRVVRVPRYRVNCINRPHAYHQGSYWRYYGSYYYSNSYENNQNHKKRERDYRPRGRSVGRSSSKKDDRNSQKSGDRSRRDDQNSDRDRSRSRSRSGSGDSGN